MSFILYSFSSSFIIIEDNEDWICLVKKFVAAKRSNEIWNVSWIFINNDKFNWQAFRDIFLTLYDFIYLWFNFLNNRSILIFLINNHIMSFNWYVDKSVLCLSKCFFDIFCALANFCLIKFQIFIFSIIIITFHVNTRSLFNNWSMMLMLKSKKSKLIRDSNS
jgi:hypothetical protein